MSAQRGPVLVVDDQPDWRATLSGLLLDEGYDVCVASTRAEAIRAITDNQFAIAILDVRLDESEESNREGLLLMRDIKEAAPATAIIILTGYADVEMVQEALQPNSDGFSCAFSFLQKTEINELTKYVSRAIRLAVRAESAWILELISQGEGQQLEFKSSIRWDLERRRVNKDLQEAAAIAVAGMLNSEGGIVLVGVADDGAIIGVEADLKTLRKQNMDGFQLVLTDILERHLGLACMPCISMQAECIDGKSVCVVLVEKSPSPVFLMKGDDHQFWVRVGNSTRSLDVKETMRYVKRHWGRV